MGRPTRSLTLPAPFRSFRNWSYIFFSATYDVCFSKDRGLAVTGRASPEAGSEGGYCLCRCASAGIETSFNTSAAW